MRFAVKIFYDGENFKGFQKQPNVPTVEDEILKALKACGLIRDGKESMFNYAGRTDAGVHALGQVISFNSIKDEIDIFSLNDYLPYEIIAWAYIEVDPDFNARKHAYLRWYRYVTPYNGEEISKMKEAAKLLIGTHDFSYLSKPVKDQVQTRREVKTAVLRKEHENIVFDITGASFLWKMVRKIWSALQMVGRREISVEDFRKLLDKEKNIPLTPAEPENLVLMDVFYEIPFIVSSFAVKEIIYYLKKKQKNPKERRPVFQSIIEDLQTRIK